LLHPDVIWVAPAGNATQVARDPPKVLMEGTPPDS
jgi:hypothetical protein